MPWWSLALILATVTVVAAVRPVKLQSTLYSLPIPLTLGLIGSGADVSRLQPLSVFGVVLFFYIVSGLRTRLRWQTYPATIGSALIILGLLELLAIPDVTSLLWPTALALVAWATSASLALKRLSRAPVSEPDRPGIGQVDVVSVVAVVPMLIIVALTAGHIGSVGAMFPFAGMCVSLAVQTNDLPEFSDRFAVRSIGLIGYNASYALVATEVPRALAIGIGWSTYLVLLAASLLLERRVTTRAN